MKLNNKGITTIEILICFVLVVIITVSMYTIISTFNEKKIIEGYKEEITTYKNTLTKEIQDDFIKIGINKANYEKKMEDSTSFIEHKLTCTMKDGSTRILKITQTLAKSEYHPGGLSDVDDDFKIEYGKSESDLIEYPIPDLGSFKNEYNHTVKDLSVNNVIIGITDDNVLSVYIGFYHPDLGTRYAIDIVCPINYIFGGAEANNNSTWENVLNS